MNETSRRYRVPLVTAVLMLLLIAVLVYVNPRGGSSPPSESRSHPSDQVGKSQANTHAGIPAPASSPSATPAHAPLSWATLPKLMRLRSPSASYEMGARSQEERVLLEEGMARDEIHRYRRLIDEIDRRIDEQYGLPEIFHIAEGGLPDAARMDQRLRGLLAAANGSEAMEGIDPQALRVRAICRLSDLDKAPEAMIMLGGWANADPDPDVRVAAAMTMAAWEANAEVALWMDDQTDPEILSTFIGVLRYPKIGAVYLDAHTRRERLLPRCSEALAEPLLAVRQASSDPRLRSRALDVLGLCAYEGKSAIAVDELFREAISPASPKSQAMAFRGLNNALEMPETRRRLLALASGSDLRLSDLSVHTLGVQLAPDSISGLGEILASAELQKARTIIEALGRARGHMVPLARAELERCAHGHPDPTIRDDALSAVGTLEKGAEVNNGR